MSEAHRLNEILLRDAPAAGRCLSPLGRRAVFPRGIPWQTAAAKSTKYNGTIGQVTDGYGNPMALEAMAGLAPELDGKIAWLYSPADGHQALREAWGQRQRAASLGSKAPSSLPLVTHGLSQAVALIADLFADPDTDVVLPEPAWENYDLLFTLRPGANIVTWPFYRDGKFNVEGFAETLAGLRRKSIVMVNFPSNPTGYTPTPEEAAQVVEAILAIRGPAVVLFDDAYAGLVWEPGLMRRSIYWDVIERYDPERIFPIKTDGATKELFFFGGRMGFLTAPVSGEAEEALYSKWKCAARSANGVTAGPSQALVLAALKNPDLERQIEERKEVLRQRYVALKAALAEVRSDALIPYPFNSGVFALIGLAPSLDAETMRQRLITEQSVGTIAIPSVNALRVAFCSVALEAIPELVRRLDAAATAVRPA